MAIKRNSERVDNLRREQTPRPGRSAQGLRFQRASEAPEPRDSVLCVVIPRSTQTPKQRIVALLTAIVAGKMMDSPLSAGKRKTRHRVSSSVTWGDIYAR